MTNFIWYLTYEYSCAKQKWDHNVTYLLYMTLPFYIQIHITVTQGYMEYVDRKLRTYVVFIWIRVWTITIILLYVTYVFVWVCVWGVVCKGVCGVCGCVGCVCVCGWSEGGCVWRWVCVGGVYWWGCVCMCVCVYSPASKWVLGSLLVLGLIVLPFSHAFLLLVVIKDTQSYYSKLRFHFMLGIFTPQL